MFNFLKRFTTETPEAFALRQIDGKYAIVNVNANTAIATYTRKRDAVRGAARKGLTLANA